MAIPIAIPEINPPVESDRGDQKPNMVRARCKLHLHESRIWCDILQMNYKKPIVLALLTLLLGALACNFPLRVARSVPEFTAEHLRQTVEAMPPPADEQFEAADPSTNTDSPYTPPTPFPTPKGLHFEYVTRPGDTLAGLTGRFGFEAGELQLDPPLSPDVYLPDGERLFIPNVLDQLSPSQLLLPDSELVYSPTASDFDVGGYVRMAGGYLYGHQEQVNGDQILSGVQIVNRVSSELSVNPRLLLAIIDIRSGWLFDTPPGASKVRFPIGFNIPGREGLYEELRIAATQLNVAYYGWRGGSFDMIEFEDGTQLRLHPSLNAGSIAIMHLFTYFTDWEGWTEQIYGVQSFALRYHNLFGDAWARADASGALLPSGLAQPELVLPFRSGEYWSLTGGPHNAWNSGTPLGALDFSPITGEEPCAVSVRWVTASAPGIAVRARDNAVALDLDGDGNETTGWVLIYFHLSSQSMVAEGARLERDQMLGHPSCEGGRTTGTHVHIARKYNGEWLPADGPVPFVLSGWRVEAGERIYAGKLTRGDQAVTADPSGRAGSSIQR